MAKNDKAAPPQNGNAASVPDRFREIATERYMYNVNKCWEELSADKRLPLVGILLSELEMPPIKERDWTAFLILTTEPTHVVNRDKDVILVEAGTEVLIPATHQLRSHFARAAGHPTAVFEVRVQPKKKIPIGGGQTMWTFALANNPKPLPRAKFGTAALLNAPAPTAPALPAAAEREPGDDSDIPFG